MARQPVRNQVPQNPITAGVNAEAQQQAFAEAARRADENARAQNATQATVKAATATGIPLPAGAASKGQSPANRAAIARSVAAGVAGNQMAQTPPTYQPSRMPAPTHMPNGMPSYSPSGAAPASVPFRGSTPAEIAEFNKGATPASDVAAAAGTGRNVTTPYGDVSSAPDKFAGQVQGPNLAGPAGKPNWEQEVVNAHPAIGQPGTPENKAFVSAWKAKYPNGSPKNPTDHMDIADAAVGNANRLPGSPLTLQSGVQPSTDPNSLAPTSQDAAAAAAKSRTAALEAGAQSSAPAPRAPGVPAASSPAPRMAGINGPATMTPPPIPAGAQTPNSTPASRGVTYSPNPDAPQPSATPTVDRYAAQQAAPVDLKAAKSYADVFHSSVGPLFGAGGDTPFPSTASFNPQSFALAPSTPSNSGMGAVPSYVPAQNDQNSNTANF